MQYIIWGIVAAAVGLAAWWYRRMRQKRDAPMISLVALLREPMTFDATVLARTAGRAWEADLGDGSAEGADGSAVCAGPVNMIRHGERMYLINCFDRPYVDDVESAAEAIGDLRIRQPFVEHRAWFSCDVLRGGGPLPTDDELRDWYQRLGKLLAAFLDENCLLIFVPQTNCAYPIDEETEQALRSDDPLTALQENLNVPLIQVPDDDPLMKEAVAKARENWPRFVTAFEAANGKSFSAKAPISHADTTEFIWLTVTAVEGDRIYGTLANDPVDLGPLKLGSKVTVKLAELNDWCYVDSQGNMQGGFTIAAVGEALRRRQASGRSKR